MSDRYVGFCNHGGWGGSGDVTGTLIVEGPDGWSAIGNWISSNESFSRHDIARLVPAQDGIEYEWAGVVSFEEARRRWPPAPQPAPTEEGEPHE